jgi:hypothetical protein
VRYGPATARMVALWNFPGDFLRAKKIAAAVFPGAISTDTGEIRRVYSGFTAGARKHWRACNNECQSRGSRALKKLAPGLVNECLTVCKPCGTFNPSPNRPPHHLTSEPHKGGVRWPTTLDAVPERRVFSADTAVRLALLRRHRAILAEFTIHIRSANCSAFCGNEARREIEPREHSAA